MSTNESTIITNATAEMNTSANTKFPTAGLKSLLQNSDLLEILLRPLSKSPDMLKLDGISSLSPPPPPPTMHLSTSPVPSLQIPPVLTTQMSSTSNSCSPLGSASNFGAENVIDLLPINQQLDVLNDLPELLGEKLEHKVTKTNGMATNNNSETGDFLELLGVKSTGSEGENNPAKIYGNPFLGPNLWDKNDLFQGGVQFEHLEIDEFLNENGLSETDVQFLDQIQKLDNNTNELIPSPSSASSSLPSTSSGVLANTAAAASANASFSSSHASNDDSLHMSKSTPELARSTAAEIKSSKSSSKSRKVVDVPLPVANRPKTRYQKKKTNRQSSPTKESAACESSILSADDELRSRKRHKLMDEKISEMASSSRDLSLVSMTSGDNDDDDDDDDSDDSEMEPMSSQKFSDDDLRPQPVLRKSKKQFVPNELKDEKYWSRRRKNNIAAKRSRDARRMKENQIAIRASYLERENDLLRKQLDEFRRETKTLKQKVTKYESIYPDLAARFDNAK